ncbi:MAG: YrdB family protein [Actinobacteria bacterium]|nr:YrdB family protein [Actinomycetota bacterium]
MTRYPFDRALCAFIELAAVLAYGYWAWAVHDGYIRYAWMLLALIVALVVWDVFRVPGDGSSKPRVPVPGWVRLIIEAGFFTGAGTSLVATGAEEAGVLFMLLVAVHYSLTHRRVLWLLREEETAAD